MNNIQSLDNTLNEILMQLLQNILNNKQLEENEINNLLVILYNELLTNFSNQERKNLIAVILYSYLNYIDFGENNESCKEKKKPSNVKQKCNKNPQEKEKEEKMPLLGTFKEELNDENMKEILDSFLVIRNK